MKKRRGTILAEVSRESQFQQKLRFYAHLMHKIVAVSLYWSCHFQL